MKGKIDHKQRAHAMLSASGASRWLACTPSARLESDEPNSSSVFAEEGTLAHELAEVALREQLALASTESADEAREKYAQSELYSAEMLEHAKTYADYNEELFNEAVKRDPDAIMLPEVRVDFSKYVPDGFGTCDNTIIGGNVLDVIDFKYGKGVAVSAHDNPQLKLYGLGALLEFSFMYPDIDTVRLHIFQPRTDNISTYEITAGRLLAWAEATVAPKAAAAYRGEGEQVPGDHCRFCKAQYKCRALQQQALDVARKDFADPRELDDDELLDMLDKADRLKKYLDSIAKHVQTTALAGKKWPGYKLVEGSSSRRIADDELAIKRLKRAGFKQSEYMIKKLNTITALEKLIGKADFSKVLGDAVVKPEGKPTLAPEDDKRPEITLASDFD